MALKSTVRSDLLDNNLTALRGYRPVGSLLKAISILKAFDPSNYELSIADISRKAEIPKSTARRLLGTLSMTGLLERDAGTGKFKIGPGLYTVGNLYLNSTNLYKAADPVVKMVNNLTGEAVSVAILDKGYVSLILREESKYALRWHSHVGTITPAYASAMGKALLSNVTDEMLDAFYPKEKLRPVTKKTIATKTELKRELDHIRKSGISIDREGGYEGVEGISSVIRDAQGRAIAAMAIALPTSRINANKQERLAKLVKLAASLISYRMGYPDVTEPIHDADELRVYWTREKRRLNLLTNK